MAVVQISWGNIIPLDSCELEWEGRVSPKTKILVVSDSSNREQVLLDGLSDSVEVVTVQSMIRALAQLARNDFDGVYVSSDHLKDAFQVGKLLQNEKILEGMPDGIALLDSDNTIIWANGRLRKWCGEKDVLGANFYSALGSPEILGPDYCPFHTALSSNSTGASTRLRSQDAKYYHVHATSVHEPDNPPRHLIVTVRDVTDEELQKQKLEAIHQAGADLADILPGELVDTTVEERIDLLKSNILHHTKDLLNYGVVEIRLLDSETGRLESLLAEGIEEEAANRELIASPRNNGVTGFVAATGKSYLCEDTTEDPLYFQGAVGAKSSLTVPLMLHDEVIGTFNVESPEPRAFNESDLQFLEIFTRDVAVALNTLDLLVAEKASTTAESVEAIHSAVALPVDDILNDAVNVMEHYIGHDREVLERLQCILRNARDIKQVIQTVGQKMAPTKARPLNSQVVEQAKLREKLRDRKVLVVDDDDDVRGAAHRLLEPYDCVVETAHNGEEACLMVRNVAPSKYDAIISDIQLPDMNGHDLLLKLQAMLDHVPVPLGLMKGFGYDRDHVIVKARQAGVRSFLYKPFRLDQLLETIVRLIDP